MISTTEPPRVDTALWTPLKAIIVGGLIAGAFDMSYALLWFSGVKGVPAIKVPQSIAGGLIGKSTYDGGAATAILGVGLHWFIALTWATVFVLVARRLLPVLLRKPIPFGIAYGAWIYFFMNWVVLPLDAMHTKPHFAPWDTWLTGLAVHMFGLGLAISLSAAKTYDQRSIRA
jgi:uncharacterized membrane protein YagU involved in acid resistance